MNRQGSGGLELAWILWTCVAALFLIFGIAELVSSQQTVSFWLVAGLVGASCSIVALTLSLRGSSAGDTPDHAMVAGAPNPGDKEAILGSTLYLAQTQLLAQVADDASLDGRTTGLVGFNGALLAATIAAKDLLGKWWWGPLAVVAVSTLVLVRSLFGRLDSLLAKNQRPGNLDLGKPAARYFEDYGDRSAAAALGQVLSDLDGAFDANAKQISAKRRRFQAAIGVLIAGLSVAALLIATHRPTNVTAVPKLPPPTTEGHVGTGGPLKKSGKTR